MNNSKKILAIIPARGGSKRVPKKNVKLLGGKPLIAWAIDEAKKSQTIDKIIVSSDCLDILEVSKKYGADTVMRPIEISQDHSSSIDAVRHVLSVLRKDNFSPDIIVILQPTTPFRDSEDIRLAILKFMESGRSSLVAMKEFKPYWAFKEGEDKEYIVPMFEKFIKTRSQDLPKALISNGAMYITTPEDLEKNNGFFSSDTIPFIMPDIKSIDIDTELDFSFAEFLLQNK